MNAKVSITKCPDYSQQLVDTSIHQVLEPLGGIAHFVKPGQKVLIKPNVLMGKSPDDAVTTHPAVISAVIREVIRAGGIALVGDSPGNIHSKVPETMKQTGITQAVEAAGGKMVYFQQEGVEFIPSPSGNQRIKVIPIAKAVMAADVIINLAKLKTHGLTLYTGAVKNMFGSVPGFYKSQFHFNNPDPADFAESIIDVYAITAPRLNIIDAVIGMEGKGPSYGQPRKMGLIIASTDGVAADAVGSYLIGYEPLSILTNAVAHDRHVGEAELKNIEISGPPLSALRQADWRHASNLSSLLKWLPAPLFKLLTGLIRIDPVIDQSKCVRCLVCVNNCPAKTIITHPPAKGKANPPPSLFKRGGKEGGELRVVIDLKDCIHCFCCHELCEYKAIELKGSWLAKLLGFAS